MRVFSKYCQLGFIVLLMTCAIAKAEINGADSISPKQASVMFAEQKAVIVDVREDSEWNEQHIPGAIHIPLAQLNERLPELKQYKDSSCHYTMPNWQTFCASFGCLKVGRIF